MLELSKFIPRRFLFINYNFVVTNRERKKKYLLVYELNASEILR